MAGEHKLMWPFRKRVLTPEQIEDRDWRKYRDDIACTLAAQGSRGEHFSVQQCFAWADAVVAERRAERAKWLAEAARPAERQPEPRDAPNPSSNTTHDRSEAS